MTAADDETVTELLALEQARCRAISEADTATLASLLSDDLTHTHVTGRTQAKADYLSGLLARPRQTTRSAIAVTVHGDVAIMTGTLRNVSPETHDVAGRVSDIAALQVWVRVADLWRMTAFAASGPLKEADR